MIILNGTCVSFLYAFSTLSPEGREMRRKNHCNVNTAMQIKTFLKSEVIQRCKTFLYSGVVMVGAQLSNFAII